MLLTHHGQVRQILPDHASVIAQQGVIYSFNVPLFFVLAWFFIRSTRNIVERVASWRCAAAATQRGLDRPQKTAKISNARGRQSAQHVLRDGRATEHGCVLLMSPLGRRRPST